MNNSQIKELCLSLMKANTEDEVIALLQEAGYWTDNKAWRYYGDRDTNYNAIGNQQSRPEAALVEKIVNAVDARLMNECLVRSIDPESANAPKNIQEAVALFFEDGVHLERASAGRISCWSNTKRTDVARGITVAATGAGPREGKPCITIADCGEGQTPDDMPETLLSLDRKNKFRIYFVQGKFNMGGTGALKFCGRFHLQLVVSKRNPNILSKKQIAHPSDNQWGFTIVRRENPEGGGRSSVYTYLAPLRPGGTAPQGDVLRFSADTMPIFPEGSSPYARSSQWGTLIKLYEYSGAGYSNTNILLRDGLLSRLDLLLPDIALPIRLHECRSTYRGHKGSFDTTLSGLSVRLSDNKSDNLEDGFPDSTSMRVIGEQITTTIYAFKKGKAETYRKNEGVIFVVNGQTHGYLTADFFRRKQVGLSYLSDSILVVVDCSQFTNMAREDLFMNSRDRLLSGERRLELEHTLEELLKHHEGLRALKESRRRDEIESKIGDSKPLEEVLKSLLERYPTLSALFLTGNSASNPFKTKKAQVDEKPFVGERYPTYFRFKGKNYGIQLQRECSINLRCRVIFDTDAVNDYFSRDIDPGVSSLCLVSNEGRVPVENYSLNSHNGIATLSFRLPSNCLVGEILQFVSIVTDPSRVEAFENIFSVRVKEAVEAESGGGHRHESTEKGDGKEKEAPAGIQLPKPTRVYEADWEKRGFEPETALIVKYAGETEESGQNTDHADVYDFFINMDNVHLRRHLKYNLKNAQQDDRVTLTRFETGMVLVGLSLLNQATRDKKANGEKAQEDDSAPNIEDQVASVTKALAQFLLPMIEALGALG